MGANKDESSEDSSSSSEEEELHEEMELNDKEPTSQDQEQDQQEPPQQTEQQPKMDTQTDAPTLSKSWSIASAHVPIFTGGKVIPCYLEQQNSEGEEDVEMTKEQEQHEEEGNNNNKNSLSSIHHHYHHSCLLLPVGGDLAIVDAERGIKLGSVRAGGNDSTHTKHNNMIYNDEDDDDDGGIDADAITTYALSNNNHKMLITCSHNHLVRQYSFQMNKESTTSTNSNNSNNQTTTEERKTAAASATTASVTLEKTWGRSGHTLPVTAMEFHISNVFLATASVDGTVRIWDVRGGHVTHIFRPLAGGTGGGSGRLSVTCIRWLPDVSNLVIAVGRDDGSIAIHNLRDKDMKHVVVLRDHLSAVTCMDWWWGRTPEDEQVTMDNTRRLSSSTVYPAMFITAGRDAVLNLWSIDQAAGSSTKTTKKTNKSKNKSSAAEMDSLLAPMYRRIHTLPVYEQVEGLAILPHSDGQSLAVATAGSKGKVRVWESALSQDADIPVLSLRKEQPATQAFGEARGGYLGMLRMSLPRKAEESSSGRSTREIDRLVVADAEHCLSFLSLREEEGKKATPLAVDQTIVGYNDEVLDLKIIPSLSANEEASEIVVATNSAQVRIFGLGNFSCDVLDRHTATVLCVDVSPCGRYIATCGKDKKMYIWHTQSRKCVAGAVGHTEAVGATALSRKAGRYDVRGKAAKNGGGAFVVTVSVDRTLKRWNLPGSADLNALAESDNVEEMSLDSFVSARAHEKDINVVSVAPNDSLIATGSQDKTVKLWRSTDLASVATLKGHRRGVWDCQFSPFDRVIATASGDRSIRLWSLTDYSCVRTFQGHVSSVLRVRFLNGGLQLMSSGGDGLVKLWTIRTNECEATMDGHTDKVWALDVAPLNKTVVTGGADSQILVWQDTTREAEDAKRAEREEAILMDQRLANHLRHKEFSQALDIALSLDKPRLTLKVLNSIIETDLKEKRNPTTSLKTYVPSWSMDRIGQILRYCREWNTRARNCDIAMLVIQSIVAVMPVEKLAAGDGIPEILAGVTPYAERHFDRLDRLFASSYLLDFALFNMGSLDKDESDFAAWESRSKLVLPPAHIDGRIQVGGKAIVGPQGQGHDEESDGEVSTVGDSDSSSDEE